MSLPIATLSDWHIIVLAFLVVLLFGGKKLPEVARGLGEAMREFKKASREVTDEIQNATTDTPQKPAANGQPQPAPTVSQSSNPPKV